jgi:hypothetical protein
MQQKNSLQRRTQSTKTTFVSIKTHANSKEIQESIFFFERFGHVQKWFHVWPFHFKHDFQGLTLSFQTWLSMVLDFFFNLKVLDHFPSNYVIFEDVGSLSFQNEISEGVTSFFWSSRVLDPFPSHLCDF